MKILRAALLYYACVFGAGFLLGMIRVPFLVPRLGARTAELLEMPVMFVVILVAARWIDRRCALGPGVPERLGVGMLALALVLATEFSLVLWLQGISLAGYFATRDPVSGTAYYALLLLFAAMPALIGLRKQPGRGRAG